LPLDGRLLAGAPDAAVPNERDQLTSRAWRPPYQPQLGHTTWGSLAWAHWGQTERGGTLSVQLDARRVRLFIFEVFFLGTAIVV